MIKERVEEFFTLQVSQNFINYDFNLLSFYRAMDWKNIRGTRKVMKKNWNVLEGT